MQHGTPQQVALRCRIVLAAAEGQSETAIARQLGTNRKTVSLWRTRFTKHGLEGLWQIGPGRGRKPTYGPEKIKAIVEATLQTKPSGMHRPRVTLGPGGGSLSRWIIGEKSTAQA